MDDAYLPDIHRMLPQSPDAEKGLISSALLLPDVVLSRATHEGVISSYFHVPAHAIIWQAMMDMSENGEPIDIISITQFLRDNGKLEECGGAALISSLLTFVPTAANASYYTEIIEEKYTLRSVIKTCTQMAARAYDNQEDVPMIVDELEQMANQIARNRYRLSDRVKTMQENVAEAIEQLCAIRDGKAPCGLKTGLSLLDNKLGGFQKGEITVLTGTTGGGKTSFAHTVLANAAIDQGKAVMLFSYEMPRLWVTKRILCARGMVDTERMRTANLTEGDMTSLKHAGKSVREAQIFIEDNADLGIVELRSLARQRKSAADIALIVIDYVQKIVPKGRGHNMRQREVAEISDGLQKMSMELDVPVLVLAQQNEEGEAREARDIAFDAKTVLKIKRHNEETPIEKEDLNVRRDIIISKNNNGAVGIVPVMFQKNFVRFANYQGEYEDGN